MNRIDAIIARVITRESDLFTNNPADSGGPTKYGITLAALSGFWGKVATEADIRALTYVGAQQVYLWRFVRQPAFDQVLPISEAIAAELVDTGVLCGPPQAAMFLQRVLNAFNRNGKLYSDIAIDGEAGNATRVALRCFLAGRREEGEAVLVTAMNALLGEYLIALAERRPKDEEFAYGWMKSRVLDAA